MSWTGRARAWARREPELVVFGVVLAVAVALACAVVAGENRAKSSCEEEGKRWTCQSSLLVTCSPIGKTVTCTPRPTQSCRCQDEERRLRWTLARGSASVARMTPTPSMPVLVSDDRYRTRDCSVADAMSVTQWLYVEERRRAGMPLSRIEVVRDASPETVCPLVLSVARAWADDAPSLEARARLLGVLPSLLGTDRPSGAFRSAARIARRREKLIAWAETFVASWMRAARLEVATTEDVGASASAVLKEINQRQTADDSIRLQPIGQYRLPSVMAMQVNVGISVATLAVDGSGAARYELPQIIEEACTQAFLDAIDEPEGEGPAPLVAVRPRHLPSLPEHGPTNAAGLSVWRSSERDYVVAGSPMAAMALWREAFDPGEICPAPAWDILPKDTRLTILDERHQTRMTETAEVWAATCGRGALCTANDPDDLQDMKARLRTVPSDRQEILAVAERAIARLRPMVEEIEASLEQLLTDMTSEATGLQAVARDELVLTACRQLREDMFTMSGQPRSYLAQSALRELVADFAVSLAEGLHVYRDKTVQYVIARSPEDATAAVAEEIGERVEDLDLTWERVPEDQPIRVRDGEGADSLTTVRFAWEWVIANGRGVLCSTEV